jgi:hypothetical protein
MRTKSKGGSAVISTTKEPLWNLKRLLYKNYDGLLGYYVDMLKEMNEVGR